MNFILIWIISLPVFANSFSLKETGSRFDLSISPNELVFNSEAQKIKIKISKCNLDLAKNLNAELLGKLPKKEVVQGLSFYLDEKPIKIDPQSDIAMASLAMDARMLRFLAEERASCK